MVSVITEQLSQQTLEDESFPQHLPSSVPIDSAFGVASNCQVSSHSSHLSERKDDRQKNVRCGCDIVPVKRLCMLGRTVAGAADVTLSANCGYDSLTRRHDVAAGSELKSSSSSTSSVWRPSLRATSLWRPVGGPTLQPQLSPLPVRQSRSSEHSSPSESPSPRPASASSGFFDSSQGSLNCALFDGVGPSVGVGSSFTYVLPSSCETMEEPILNNANSSVLVSAGSACRSSISNIGNVISVSSSESLPVIYAFGSDCHATAPFHSSSSSTDTLRPVRCHSTDLTRNRRSRTSSLTKKRPWPHYAADRPKLDFHKMTKTAYDKSNRCRLRASHHVQFAADSDPTLKCDQSPRRCYENPDCLVLTGSPSSVGNETSAAVVARGRLSLDSCGSETLEDTADITAFSSASETNCATFPRIDGEQGIEEEVEEVFNAASPDNDLDIDQIEND